jgi:CTP-dependent riboflavin kinase
MMSLGLIPFKVLTLLEYCDRYPGEATKLGLRRGEDENWMGIALVDIRSYLADKSDNLLWQSLKIMEGKGYVTKTIHKRLAFFRITKGGKKALKEAVGEFDPYFWALL